MTPKILDMDERELTEEIERNYKLNVSSQFKPIGGYSSQNYVFQSNTGQYVLKIFSHSLNKKTKHLELVTNFLQAHELPVCQALTSISNRRCHDYGSACYSIYPFTEGQVLNEPGLTKAHLESTAELLAKLHSVSTPFPSFIPHSEKERRRESDFSTDDVMDLISSESLGVRADQVALKLIEKKHRAMELYHRDNSIDTQITHGDFHSQNLVFSGSQIVRLLDLEEVHVGNRMEDVATFTILSCFDSQFILRDFSKAKHFVRAYSQHKPLKQEEFEFGMNFWLKKKFSSTFLEKSMYQKRDPDLLPLLERDLRIATYFESELPHFVDAFFKEKNNN